MDKPVGNGTGILQAGEEENQEAAARKPAPARTANLRPVQRRCLGVEGRRPASPFITPAETAPRDSAKPDFLRNTTPDPAEDAGASRSLPCCRVVSTPRTPLNCSRSADQENKIRPFPALTKPAAPQAAAAGYQPRGMRHRSPNGTSSLHVR